MAKFHISLLNTKLFRAQSDIQYGRQADILDFVFQTVTAERVTQLISYFCGIAG
jgi:hypothetical protein